MPGSTLPYSRFSVRLVAGILALNLIVLMVVALTLYESRKQYDERAIVTAENLSHSLGRELASSFDKIDLTLLSVADEVSRLLRSGNLDASALNTFIARQAARLPDLSGLRISDAQGNLRYGTGLPTDSLVNVADREEIIYQRDHPDAGLVVGKPIVSRVNGKWIIALTRRLNQLDGSFAGTAVAVIELDKITDKFATLNIGKHGVIVLLDQEQALLARYPAIENDKDPIGQKTVSRKFEEQLRIAPEVGSFQATSPIEHMERAFSYQNISGYPFFLLVGLSADDYLNEWWIEVLRNGIFMAIFALVTLGFSWWMLGSWKRLRQNEQKFRTLLESVPDPLVIADANGLIVLANNQVEALFGYESEELVGQPVEVLLPQRYHGGHVALRQGYSHAPRVREMGKDQLLWAVTKQGREVPINVSLSPIQTEQGLMVAASIRDVSERKAAEEQIAFLAYRDALTGLPNRALLKDRTAHTISMVQRAAEPMTIMMLAIDHLKAINDTLGHNIGDELMVEMTKRLSDSVREQDTVARLHGKEFVLVLPGTATSGAATLASELLWKLAQPYKLGDHELTMTASIGIASYPDNGDDFDSLFKAVEITLHRVQASGRNTFQFYSAGMHQEMLARDHMTKALRNAVALDQLQLAYQPLVDLQTGQISGLEALLRWHHPELGSVSPATFIPLAEESNLIKGIGEWVLQRACRDIRAWLDKGIKVPHVAVNVSPLQFHDPDLVAKVKCALSDYQVDPARIYIEVTEGALMDDVPRSEGMLKELKDLGVKLSLDDFGTGYSSLSYLKRFPFDKVKIDRSFVRDIITNLSDGVLVKVIVSMAHGLGMRVVAEGVETEAQCEIMRTSICDEIQGYFFSKPISAQAVEELFSEGRHLPSHLLRLQKPQRTMLLVDDEPNIVASLKRLFRRDGHVILTANSGPEGLDLLSKHRVDIIISDQRMPGMTGVEFLRIAKANYPDTIRIVLSGYTELQSVTDAINEGAVYRFLTKPWEDEQLREHIRKAFEYKGLLEENRQLDIKIRTSNQELVAANRQLGEVLQNTRNQAARDEVSLTIMREALRHIPLAVMGVDDEGLLAFVNAAAESLFAGAGPLLGTELAWVLPAINAGIAATAEGVPCELQVRGTRYRLVWHTMGESSRSRGKLVTLTPTGGAA